MHLLRVVSDPGISCGQSVSRVGSPLFFSVITDPHQYEVKMLLLPGACERKNVGVIPYVSYATLGYGLTFKQSQR